MRADFYPIKLLETASSLSSSIPLSLRIKLHIILHKPVQFDTFKPFSGRVHQKRRENTRRERRQVVITFPPWRSARARTPRRLPVEITRGLKYLLMRQSARRSAGGPWTARASETAKSRAFPRHPPHRQQRGRRAVDWSRRRARWSRSAWIRSRNRRRETSGAAPAA